MNKKIVSAVMIALTLMGTTVSADEYANGVQVKRKYDFDFSLSGPNVKYPNQVFTDGKQTWLQYKDISRPPVVFANEKPVSFKVEGQFLVVSGVYPSISLVDGRDGTVVQINYDGVYPSTTTGVIHSVSKPIAINGVASLPSEEPAAPTYNQVNPAQFNVMPLTMASKPAVQTQPDVAPVTPAATPAAPAASLQVKAVRLSPQSQKGWIRASAPAPRQEEPRFQTMQYQVQPASVAPKFNIMPAINVQPVQASAQPAFNVTAQVKPVAKPIVMKVSEVTKVAPIKVSAVTPVQSPKMTGSFVLSPVGNQQPQQPINNFAMPEETVEPPKAVVSVEDIKVMKVTTSDVGDHVSLPDEVLVQITQYVLDGYKLFITGKAGTSTEVSRLARANNRAVNAMKEIVKFGISQKSVSVAKLRSYPSVGDSSGVEIKLVKS